ncbi:GGDEF domain-containing protein, partial [Mesorhizobium sp. M4A.F.Ca.ET.050.02.1.1]
GERIKARVRDVYFAPKGTEDVLAVQVGGVIFEHELAFEDMFRSAEERLSAAQDRLEFSHLSS